MVKQLIVVKAATRNAALLLTSSVGRDVLTESSSKCQMMSG